MNALQLITTLPISITPLGKPKMHNRGQPLQNHSQFHNDSLGLKATRSDTTSTSECQAAKTLRCHTFVRARVHAHIRACNATGE